MAEEATTQAEVTTPPEQATAPVEAAPEPAWLGKVKELGFENVTSADEAIERLASAYKQTKDEFGAQLQQTIEQLRSQPTPQPQVQPDAQDGHWWNPPKVDTALVAKYRAADGTWKPETPSDFRQQAEAYQAYLERWATDLVHRPNEVLPKLIEAEARRIVREELGQTQQQQQLTQFQSKVFSDNPWLFEKDPVTGQTKTNTLSAEGKLVDAYMQEAQARGADYEFAWDYAFTKHQAAKAAAQSKQTTTAQTAAEINAQKKQEALNRAAGGGVNRAGSLPAPSDNRASQRNPNLRPGQRFKQIADREGIALS